MPPTCLKRPRGRSAAWFWTLAMGLLLAGGGLAARAADAVPTEQQLKAAFLVNFTKYVDWPAEAFVSTNSPFVLGVMGLSRLDAELQKMVAGRNVNGRPIVLKHVMADADLGSCQMLFICISHHGQAKETLAKLKNSSVLTVGESEDFLDSGGMINLATSGRKVRVQVNLATAQKAGLSISSKLLAAAEAVKGK
jgi:hypothetical protein